MDQYRVAVITLGCKVNQYESHTLENYLTKNNFKIVNHNDTADIVIINTCAVTLQAARKSRQIIRQARRKNSKAFIIVIGCYLQQKNNDESVINTADVILGTNNKSKVIEIIEKWKNGVWNDNMNSGVSDISLATKFEEMPASAIGDRVRAEVKVQDGCQQYCAYCIIPYLRGPERSRDLDNVIKEIRYLVNEGYKEVVLTGIHLGAYGRDLGKEVNLSYLTKNILKQTELKRLRLSSVEPTDITDELIELIASNQRIAPHLHIPLQGGNNRLLQAMNRKYSIEEYFSLITKIRQAIPNIALTTDLIVGFPGETEKDFNECKQFVRKVGFSGMHVFRFSPRPGTPAAKIFPRVKGDIARQRSDEMHSLAHIMALEYHNSMIGNEYQVLVERATEDGHWEGHAENYVKVVVNGENISKNMLIKVQICSSNTYGAFGIMI